MTSVLNQPNQFPHLRRALSKYWPLMVAAGAGLLAYGGMAGLHLQTGTLRAGYTPYTLAWYSLAFGAYLGALLWTERRQGLPLSLIFAGAIAFRLLLLVTTPTLSDDVYRYMWDGYLANNGVSPYAYPIDSPALDDLDTPQRALANNRWMASPYLPAAQYLFAALVWLSPSNPLLFQMTMLIFDILNGALLVKLLRLIDLPDYRALLYLWNPLIVVESTHGAHVDTWMIFLILLALWLTFAGWERGKMLYLAPITLALATLTKGLPVLLLPVLFWCWRWRQLILYGLVIAGLVIPAGLVAGWGLSGPLDGRGLFGAIRIYADQWNFNSGLFHWLEESFREQDLVEATGWAKRITGLLLLLATLGVWLKARRVATPRAMLRLLALPLMAYILLTTTVHPWYLMTLLAFIPFLAPAPDEPARRWLATLPWLYLSWALALSYLTYLDPNDFRELEWVRYVEWWGAWGLVGVWVIFSRASLGGSLRSRIWAILANRLQIFD